MKKTRSDSKRMMKKEEEEEEKKEKGRKGREGGWYTKLREEAAARGNDRARRCTVVSQVDVSPLIGSRVA